MGDRWNRWADTATGFILLLLLLGGLAWMAALPLLYPEQPSPTRTVPPPSGESTQTPSPGPGISPAPPRPGEWTAEIGSSDSSTFKGIEWVTSKSDAGLTGYRITHVEPGSLFEKSGLREGDVVRMVDGHPLTRDDARALYDAASDGKPVRLQIDRDGRSVDTEVGTPR